MSAAPLAAGDPVSALVAQQLQLIDLVGGRDEDELLMSSRCEGWSVADVLLHMAQSNEMAVASVRGQLGGLPTERTLPVPDPGDIESWVQTMVEAERADPLAARDRYVTSSRAQEAAFRDADGDTRVLWAAGDMAARTLATTRLTETWIHTCDVAFAYGAPPAPTDRLWHTARLVWRTVPYALTRNGHDTTGRDSPESPPRPITSNDVAFDLVGPSGDRWVFGDPDYAGSTVTGDALELCEVAGQRRDAEQTSLVADGPLGPAVLQRMRTFV